MTALSTYEALLHHTQLACHTRSSLETTKPWSNFFLAMELIIVLALENLLAWLFSKGELKRDLKTAKKKKKIEKWD